MHLAWQSKLVAHMHLKFFYYYLFVNLSLPQQSPHSSISDSIGYLWCAEKIKIKLKLNLNNLFVRKLYFFFSEQGRFMRVLQGRKMTVFCNWNESESQICMNNNHTQGNIWPFHLLLIGIIVIAILDWFEFFSSSSY